MPKLPRTQCIGVVENTDPSFHIDDIFSNLYPGNIIITKRLTNPLIDKLIENKDKCILHLTVTGMGGTKVEPFTPTVEQTLAKFITLTAKGFPIENVVLRVDPIIPTERGWANVERVMSAFGDSGIKRLRFSILDMYPHVMDRFESLGFPLPFKTFHAPLETRLEIRDRLLKYGEQYGFEVEACGEPGIDSIPCLSQKDIDILGLGDTIKLVGSAGQRENCKCPANKKSLYTGKPERCQNSCVYCYWKD
ncbi:MAG: DUF1848 family protein [Paludibacteraceae bacterium]|nr:DUF1848 family protein [Paludibacteraceae bacterium]